MAKKGTDGLRKYELMLIIKANLPETERKQVVTKIQEQIKEGNGSIEEENIWGKRYLAFPIKKNAEGYYVVFNMLLNPDQSNELKRSLNLNSDVLRYLLRTVGHFEQIGVPVEVKQNKK